MPPTEPKYIASTELEARHAKPQEKLYRLTYSDGLQLEIRPKGTKYWIHRYRNPQTKKLTVYTIGEFRDNKTPPHTTLLQARTVLYELKGLIQRGIDPNTHKQRAKIQAAHETFKDIALEWYSAQLNRWSTANADQVLRCLEMDIFPYIGVRPIAELEAMDFLQVIRRTEGRGALDKARKVKQRLGAVVRYAVATGRAKFNPVPDLSIAMVAKPKGTHFNALTLKELPHFLEALNTYRSEIMRRAVQFALLTFARTGSIRSAEWVEIDWVEHLWRIPADHMKMGEAHIIPLSTQALQLLSELKPFTADSRLVFYTTHRDKELSPNALLSVLRHMGWQDKTTIHGFRALASSVLHDAGYEPHMIEKQLAHAERNKIAGAYRYMAEYMPERVKMMQFWADFLDSQRLGANVIPFKSVQAH